MATKQSKKGKKVFIGFTMEGSDLDYTDVAYTEKEAKKNFDFYWEVYLPIRTISSNKIGVVTL